MSDPTNPADSLARIDLPIRDVLRFIVPGGYASIAAAAMDHFFLNGKLGLANTSILVPVGFFFGLIGFLGDAHKCFWPWKGLWDIETKKTGQEIKAITGNSLVLRDELAKPIYKLWLEVVCSPALRGYLHYSTGIYYTAAAVTLYSGLFACTTAVYILYSIFNDVSTHSLQGVLSICSSVIWGAPGACLMVFIFIGLRGYYVSKRVLTDVYGEGRIAMQLKDGSEALHALAKAATQTAKSLDCKEIVHRATKAAILEICPADLELFLSAQCDQIINQLDVRDDAIKRIAHVTLRSKLPAVLNGQANLYVGEQQRMIEASLTRQLVGHLNVDTVRLQMAPINPFWGKKYVRKKKRIQKMDINKAIQLGIITKTSPVYRCCQDFEIDYVLVRGRYIIGPSPGLAEALKQQLSLLPTGQKIFDPFSGTGLVQKVAAKFDCNATVSLDELAMNSSIKGDAFEWKSSERFDIATIDPLYEDCLPFLALVAPKINAKCLIVQSGRSCDLEWNRIAECMLRPLGVVERFNENTYGSCIFIVTR